MARYLGRTWLLALAAALLPPTSGAGQTTTIVPFTSQPGLEVIDGDPSVAGVPYVLRIHNDSGYVVLPHVHAEIEHVVLISGSWSLALGDTYEPANLRPMEVGDYAQVPARAPHYGKARTELTIQVHGIGPFNTDYYNPIYRLAENGVFFEDMAGSLSEQPTQAPEGCFPYPVGAVVNVGPRQGTILGGQCSPTEGFTQYLLEEQSGVRFWAAADDLAP